MTQSESSRFVFQGSVDWGFTDWVCDIVDVCFVDAEETQSETNSNGEGISEGVNRGVKETRLIGFFVFRNRCCLFIIL